MHKPKNLVIVAGEESGDMHAAHLVKQLKAHNNALSVSGIGGKHMKDAGVDVLYDLAQYGVTGITEIIPHLRILRKAFALIKKHLQEKKPDLLILVDYPGFNLRLARFAKKTLGIKILYYISPQIWAWKAKRIHLIKECVDRMAVILPFEKTLYEQAGVPVSFVGHPLAKQLSASAQDTSLCRKELNLPEDKQIIALLPGSRTNEIQRHMPVLRDTAQLLFQNNNQLHFVVPIARTMNPESVQSYFSQTQLPLTFIFDKAISCMSAADFTIVASGTASLECALLNKPMCIIYKGSLITYIAAMKLIRVKFLGLCNLLAGKMIVPEFLQYDCNPYELARYIMKFTASPQESSNMIARLGNLKSSLSQEEADCSLLDLTLQEMS